jgi:hypothetical protein
LASLLSTRSDSRTQQGNAVVLGTGGPTSEISSHFKEDAKDIAVYFEADSASEIV